METSEADHGLWGWSTADNVLADGAVESSQRVWVKNPVVAFNQQGARMLASTYWRQVRASLHGLIRIDDRTSGTRVRIAGGPALLVFAPLRLEADDRRVRAVYDITGGLLARRPTGSISFSQTQLEDRVSLESAIAEFHPTLAARPGAPAFTGELYKRVQATLHVAISREYFERLIAEAGQ